MVHLAQQALVALARLCDKVVTPLEVAGPDEVNEAAFDAGDRGHGRFAGPDLSHIALALERTRALQRLVEGVDAERERADRRSVQKRERMREALALAIDDKGDLTLSVEIDVLRAMPAHVTEAEPLDQRDEL